MKDFLATLDLSRLEKVSSDLENNTNWNDLIRRVRSRINEFSIHNEKFIKRSIRINLYRHFPKPTNENESQEYEKLYEGSYQKLIDKKFLEQENPAKNEQLEVEAVLVLSIMLETSIALNYKGDFYNFNENPQEPPISLSLFTYEGFEGGHYNFGLTLQEIEKITKTQESLLPTSKKKFKLKDFTNAPLSEIKSQEELII